MTRVRRRCGRLVRFSITRHAFAFVAAEPFPDGRGRNTYGAGYGARRFARSERCDNQDLHVRRRPGILVNVHGWVS